MRSYALPARFTILAAAVAVAACSGGSDTAPTSQNGTLSVALFDAPRWDVAEINVMITGINVKPAGEGPAIEFDFDPAVLVDLLSLTPDNAEILLDGVTVPAGDYNWMELEVSADFDGMISDSFVVEDSGGIVEVGLRVPSGSIRLVSGFTVTANQETSFMIDWDMRQGLTRPPGQAGYMLRPAFRIIDMTQFGTLEGMVAMDLITTAGNGCNDDSATANPDEGNVVYVFEGHGAAPDDIDDTETDPVATIEVAQDAAGDYSFSTILSPGEYVVAFTCQAGLDDPETDDDLPFTGGSVEIEIVDGETTVVDFPTP